MSGRLLSSAMRHNLVIRGNPLFHVLRNAEDLLHIIANNALSSLSMLRLF